MTGERFSSGAHRRVVGVAGVARDGELAVSEVRRVGHLPQVRGLLVDVGVVVAEGQVAGVELGEPVGVVHARRPKVEQLGAAGRGVGATGRHQQVGVTVDDGDGVGRPIRAARVGGDDRRQVGVGRGLAEHAGHPAAGIVAGHAHRTADDVDGEAQVLVHLHVQVLVEELARLHDEEAIQAHDGDGRNHDGDQHLDEREAPFGALGHVQSRNLKADTVVPLQALKVSSRYWHRTRSRSQVGSVSMYSTSQVT